MMILLQTNWHKFLTDFGTRYELNIWDYSAVFISILSVILAVFSLFYASRTFKSQRKTELNTTPLINKNIQLFLLNNSLCELYESLISLTALYSAMEHTNYKVIPSKQFWDLVFIKTSNFHEELFWGNESKFRDFYYLTTYVNKFNSDVSYLYESIANPNIEISLKQTILLNTCKVIADLVKLWIKAYINSLDVDKKQVLSIVHENFIKCNHCKFNIILDDDKDISYPCLSNSPFEKQVNEVVDNIDDKLLDLVRLYSIDYSNAIFKKQIGCFVDALMFNVLYKDMPFVSYAFSDEPIASKYKFCISQEQVGLLKDNNTWINNGITQKPNHIKYSWIFYFKDVE